MFSHNFIIFSHRWLHSFEFTIKVGLLNVTKVLRNDQKTGQLQQSQEKFKIVLI